MVSNLELFYGCKSYHALDCHMLDLASEKQNFNRPFRFHALPLGPSTDSGP